MLSSLSSRTLNWLEVGVFVRVVGGDGLNKCLLLIGEKEVSKLLVESRMWRFEFKF